MTMSNDFRDQIAKKLFGVSPTESPNNCVKCRQSFSPTNVRTELERRESKLSGLCGICWDGLFSEFEIENSVQMKCAKEVQRIEKKIQALQKTLFTPTASQIFEFLEVHNTIPEVTISTTVDSWLFSIHEVQSANFLECLLELFKIDKDKIAAVQRGDETWYGMIVLIKEYDTAIIIGVKTNENYEPTSH